MGEYEIEVHRVLKTLIKPGQSVLEAPASQGFHTLTMASIVATGGGRVLALECDERSWGLLRTNTYAHRMGGVIEAMWLCSSSGHIPTGTPERFSVVRGLSEAIKTWKFRPDLMKLDVDALESSVVDGIGEVVASSPEIRVILRSEWTGARASTQAREVLGRLERSGMILWEVDSLGRLKATSASQFLSSQDAGLRTIVAARSLE
jgi:hypothetical protein